MTIILELPSELESRLREQAGKAGLDTDTYVLNALNEHLRQIQVRPAHLSKAETELLQKINLGLSQETWQRYYELIAKRQAEALTREEQEELIALADQVEEANARRITDLVELARLRQTSLESVMEDLGITIPPYV